MLCRCMCFAYGRKDCDGIVAWGGMVGLRSEVVLVELRLVFLMPNCARGPKGGHPSPSSLQPSATRYVPPCRRPPCSRAGCARPLGGTVYYACALRPPRAPLARNDTAPRRENNRVQGREQVYTAIRFILQGVCTESSSPGSLMLRKPDVYHSISTVLPGPLTPYHADKGRNAWFILSD